MRYDKLHPPTPLLESLTFEDRTILVTGASSGIGIVATELLARHHASHIILGVRNVSAGEKTADDVRKNHPTTKFTVLEIDMSSYKSIKSFADTISREISRLDVAILNAGTYRPEHKIVSDGWEETLMVNAVGSSLLGLLLLPKLRAAKPELKTRFASNQSQTPSGACWPHLIFVSSRAHTFPTEKEMPRDIDDWSFRRDWSDNSKYSGQTQYNRSKLALEWAAQHICKIVIGAGDKDDPDVIVNTVCPGPTFSAIGRDAGGKSFAADWAKSAFAVMFMRTTEEGTRNLIKAAELGPESMGAWWVDDQVEEHGQYVKNELGCLMSNKMWDELLVEWKTKELFDIEKHV